jgi:2,3-bisphosphoglycerate-dependent phosphoglycerate mutase
MEAEMAKKIYLIRHCQAAGQEFEARLTEEGKKQAHQLVQFLSDIKINRIITSPFKRAIDSISPLARDRELEIEIDKRLSERVLSTENLLDWQEELQMSFDDLDIAYQGGESSREAMNRGMEVINELLHDEQETILVMTHGNLMALMLKSFHPSFGYVDWKKLSNPDVYVIEAKTSTVKRIWK